MHLTSYASSPGLSARFFRNSPMRLVLSIRTWLQRRAAVRELYELDEHMLRDIGLGRGEIERAVRLGRL